MKKLYSKPEIMFEDFTLSENIAGDCEGKVGNPSKGSCTVIGTGNIAMFDGDMDICEYTPSNDDKWNKFCYHVPTEYNNLFNS